MIWTRPFARRNSVRKYQAFNMVDFAGIASASVAFLMYYNTLDAGFAYDDT